MYSRIAGDFPAIPMPAERTSGAVLALLVAG